MTTASPTPEAAAPASGEQVLIISPGFTIEGQVRGQGTVLVHGTVKGGVQADVVKLDETALVVGHIQCRQLDIAGRLDGSFETADLVVRQQGVAMLSREGISTGTGLVHGTVSGALRAARLKVERSGQITGQTQADQLDVYGQMQGEIRANDMLVRSSASVAGTLRYDKLALERGSDVSGQLERAGREKPPLPVPPKFKPEEPVVIHLPVSIVQQLRKQPGDLQVGLVGGEPLPSWISIDREHAWLVLGKQPYEQLVASGQSITLQLQAGSENLVFKLPPEAA